VVIRWIPQPKKKVEGVQLVGCDYWKIKQFYVSLQEVGDLKEKDLVLTYEMFTSSREKKTKISTLYKTRAMGMH
jgi:hypothetical protein